MGDCFESPEDFKIRIFFKEEEAYERIFQKYGCRNAKLNLEKDLYDSLVKLFQDLALQKEQQNKYDESIGHLEDQLKYLTKLKIMVENNKLDIDIIRKTEQQEIDIHLKAADLYYKQGFYSDAEKYLSAAQIMINKKPEENVVSTNK